MFFFFVTTYKTFDPAGHLAEDPFEISVYVCVVVRFLLSLLLFAFMRFRPVQDFQYFLPSGKLW